MKILIQIIIKLIQYTMKKMKILLQIMIILMTLYQEKIF